MIETSFFIVYCIVELSLNKKFYTCVCVIDEMKITASFADGNYIFDVSICL